ncbi:islet cell autoantigen 1 isoform X2 [Bacillus rossius redtenbacheri]|uniref:islet cell autoantigen 1 isoform X2 n=1 Tax=Bacillus rossius redtenbacheri TaxID=93214 RepID=UPI002FDD4692
MNNIRTSDGYSGMAYDRWIEQHASDTSKSAMAKMQHQYWVTKQTVFRKLGKKDDACIVASDAELDAKLELFRSIQNSCLDLQRIIDKYQERLCNLAQEENSMGRFLKEAGKNDKTRAGKMMTAVGKSLSYSGQQRLALRVPLMRLYQEVETFRHRAIADTLQNVNSMEKVRTEYRASLNWMKNVSQELDPDTYKQLERFRKVQAEVRCSKLRFDQLKLDCLQKVDLLAAARCNMFSHALILYQKVLLQFAEKASNTFHSVAESFRGYQHYEFSVVTELTETSLKLADQTSSGLAQDEDKDKLATMLDTVVVLLFFEAEYHDETLPSGSSDKTEHQAESQPDSSLGNMLSTDSNDDVLLDFDLDFPDALMQSHTKDTPEAGEPDFLTSAPEVVSLLDEILGRQPTQAEPHGEWEASFGADHGSFLPSQLLDQLSSLDLAGGETVAASLADIQPAPPQQQAVHAPQSQDKRTAWFNLFADLDPLSDPDALDRKTNHADRNC